jgi:hypothetical protein
VGVETNSCTPTGRVYRHKAVTGVVGPVAMMCQGADSTLQDMQPTSAVQALLVPLLGPLSYDGWLAYGATVRDVGARSEPG